MNGAPFAAIYLGRADDVRRRARGKQARGLAGHDWGSVPDPSSPRHAGGLPQPLPPLTSPAEFG